jgi:hypothetical protein
VVDQKEKEGNQGKTAERQQKYMSHIQNAQVVWGGLVHPGLEYLERRGHFHMEQVGHHSTASRHAKAAEVEEDSRLNCPVYSRDMGRVGPVRAWEWALRNDAGSGGILLSAEERQRMERTNTEHAAIAVEAGAGRPEGCSRHLRRPEGCIRHEWVADEAGHSGHSKTATDGHSRHTRAAERDLQGKGTSRSRSIRGSSTKTGEMAGGWRRGSRWSGHSAIADHATGVGSGDYTTWCLICTARVRVFSPSRLPLLDRVGVRAVCLRPALSSLPLSCSCSL